MNPIILEFGSFDNDDIKDLRYGKGKIYKRIVKMLDKLKADGTVSEDAQPVISLVKQKQKGVWD